MDSKQQMVANAFSWGDDKYRGLAIRNSDWVINSGWVDRTLHLPNVGGYKIKSVYDLMFNTRYGHSWDSDHAAVMQTYHVKHGA